MALLFWPSASASESTINRCLKYYPQVIREARFHIGQDAPAHLFMGQIEQESRCNQSVTAFDGGMGLGQFMPETAEWIQKRETALQDISMSPQPYDPRWSIRALILYDRWLIGQVACHEWHYAYRSYNGGVGRMNQEIKKAGTCGYAEVNAACKRKVIKTKWGLLDMCRVNIEYPVQIQTAGKKYQAVSVR